MLYRNMFNLLAAALLVSAAGCDFLDQLDAAGRAEQEGSPVERGGASSLPTLAPLEDISAGLGALDSYRARLTLQLLPAAGAAPLESTDMLQEVNRSQNQIHYRMSKEGNPSTDAVFEYFQIGPEFYLYTEQSGAAAGCDRMTNQQSTLLETADALTPDDIFGTIYPGQLVARGVAVNGQLADQYTVNLDRMGLGSGSVNAGELYLAQQGGYVVRFTGQVDGMILGFDTAAQQGVSNWSYDLDFVNQLGSIQLSEACRQAQLLAEQFPLPPGAGQPSTYAGTTTLTAPQPVRELADFYTTSLAAAGWQVSERMTLERLVILDANRPGTRLEITITAAEEGSSILILER